MNWIRRVHEDAYFRAIPEKVTFEEGRACAFLLDGFEIAGGVLASFAVTNRVIGDFADITGPTGLRSIFGSAFFLGIRRTSEAAFRRAAINH